MAIMKLVFSLLFILLFFTISDSYGQKSKNSNSDKDSLLTKFPLSNIQLPDSTIDFTLASNLSQSKEFINCLQSIYLINDMISKDSSNIELYRKKIEILQTCDFRILTTFGFLERAYADLLQADSTNIDALYYFAVHDQLYWLNNRHSKSMKTFSNDARIRSMSHFEKLYRSHPEYVKGVHGLVQVYLDSDLESKVPEILNKEIQTNPNSIDLLMDIASFYYEASAGRPQFLKKANEYFKESFYLMDSASQEDYQQIQHYLTGNDLNNFNKSNDKLAEAKKYWTKTTPFFLHGYNEYELEHYNRVWYAKNHFYVPGKNTNGDKTDRGKYYIAYGEPEKIYAIRSQNSTLDDTLTFAQFTSDDYDVSSDPSTIERGVSRNSKLQTASGEKFYENYERWFYGKYELKFVFNRIKNDYEFIFPVQNNFSMLSKGNYLTTPINYHTIPIKTKFLLENIDSTKSKLIAYYCIPILKTVNVKSDFKINLEEGLFIHNSDYKLLAGKKHELPTFSPEFVFTDENDSLFAVQKTSVLVPKGDLHISHEIWAKNSDYIYRKSEIVSEPKRKKNSVSIDNIILIYRELFDLSDLQKADVADKYQFIPVFSDKLKKGEKSKLFFNISNSDTTEFHDYLFEWSMTRVSSGFFTGIADVLTQRNTSTSVEFNYVHKQGDFHDAWDIDSGGYSTGNYVITLQVLDKNTRKRDRKTYSFEIVE